MFKTKKQLGATLSVSLNVILIAVKVAVGLMTGSIGVLASAIDSIIDLVSSILGYVAIYIADTPPDEDHPFGHGKFEDFAGLVQAILIILGAIFIFYEAFPKLLRPETYQISPMPALIVMVFSMIGAFIVSKILFRISGETDSTALDADAHHLSTDVMTYIAVIVGLVLVQVTGNPIFDPMMAILVAVLILMVGVRVVGKVFKHLTDTALPVQEENHILEIIHRTMPTGEPVKVESLRTKRSGSNRLIVFNLQVNPNLTVQQAHDYCDMIEDALEAEFPGSLVNIHLEPLSH